jgi:succinate dehydrogenase / fumarate reductase flavoprotein subunit
VSQIFETKDHDVIVIGAGGAGLRAAIEARAQGQSVGLICKSLLGKAHTVMAEGGIAAALANVRSEDTWQTHFRDTMRGGKMHNNWRMAQLHAQESPARVNELEAWGALFDRTEEGRINQRPFGGHTHARLAHVGDRTGLEMIRVLQDKAVHSGVDVYMETSVIRLLTPEGRVAGALAYRRESGRFLLFRAGATVIATGGIGKGWQITSNSWEYTGDGHALAYEAGAELIDMEFVQFHPTAMVWPLSVRGILVTEGVRGEGGVLLNSKNERFMFRYIPDIYKGDYAETEAEAERWVKGERTKSRRPPELLTRDDVARAITKEIAEGRGSPHGGVFLDIATKREPEYIKKKLPSMYHQFKELAGVDITKEAMEIGPTTHYVMGGIKVDADTAAATVPGLYAAGEVAGGMHGANRLGGNSLSDLVVFGRRAGKSAAAFAKARPRENLDPSRVDAIAQEALAGFERAGGENPFAIQSALQGVMQTHAGIARNQKGLELALQELDQLKVRARRAGVTGTREYNPCWHTALDLGSLLAVTEMSVRAALERKESRGGHARTDFPNSDELQARRQVVIRKEGDRMGVRWEDQPPVPPDLMQIIKGGA